MYINDIYSFLYFNLALMLLKIILLQDTIAKLL